jgi:ABC-type lipoprotein export system ATPase subunit
MSTTSISYNGNPRGSQWKKWDLHVHTPASVVQHFGNAQEDETWETYICALEALPPEIKVIGINDYFFLDGYRRVITAKKAGRLSNLDLVLPAVELRISSFAGNQELRKVNYHVIFSNELTPDQIEVFFLRKLGVEFKLDDGKIWRGDVCHLDGLIELGKAIKKSTPESKRPSKPDLQVGFSHAAFSLEQVWEAIDQTIFEGKAITAVGLAEWSQMRWDGGSAAIKKDIINRADLVFTASPSPTDYQDRLAQLRQQQVNTRLLDCSDAHFYAHSDQPNRLGNVFSWLKADLTFRGLRRVVQCFDDRVFIDDVGSMPPKLEKVQKHQVKYIRSIEIRKKSDSSLDEIWFDCEIPINYDLAAIIGNQGNGKSALTDIIALCGNTKTDDFSFLNVDKFCDKQNKAREFEATLTWEDGVRTTRVLDESVQETDFERVRYVPQGFFEAVTNETVVREGGQFYGEIKKAVFSHIAESDRLGYTDLDTLIRFRTREHNRGLSILRQELADLNSQIVALEKACAPREVERLRKEIETKKAEIKAHKSTKPSEVVEPSESVETNAQIEELRERENDIQSDIDHAKEDLKLSKKRRAFLELKKQAVENEHRRLQGFVGKLQKDLRQEGFEIAAGQLIWSEINTKPLTDAINEFTRKITEIDQQIDPEVRNSLAQQVQKLREQREALESELEKVSKAYQAYRTKLTEWQADLNELHGNIDTVGSLVWLEQRLLEITESKPAELALLKQERQRKCKEIHQQLEGLASVYQELTYPVQKHIKANPLTREKYRIEFTIKLVERDVADRLFNIVSHSTGTFSGIQEGRERLQAIADEYDFASTSDAVAFAEEVLDNLEQNYKNTPPTSVDLSRLLRTGREIKDIYNLLFGLEYVSPEYSLVLNGKPLKQLSPGERGIVLLVFYLIVDQGDEPLIIDQPEGNLNNQSIFDNLVPVFKEAKNRRQIIVVTHNPNLAVVCDAEQIIYAQIDFQSGNRVRFESGALENPIFNKLSLDVLEGTPPAFDARRLTYEAEGLYPPTHSK